MKKDIAIVIPTYNESENISILLHKILKTIPRANVFIIDDSSQDENLKLKKLIKPLENRVTLLSRNEKKGRGSAVLTGLKKAFDLKEMKFFFEMDADLAHNPEEINKFLNLSHRYDVIIGSRYKSGSKIIKWPLRRLVLSKLINMMLNLLFGLKLSDYTNGFRFYNRKAVSYLTSINLIETGFIALSETIYKLRKAGFRIGEVPISFNDRKYGKSNAGLTEHLDALKGIIRIRFSS